MMIHVDVVAATGSDDAFVWLGAQHVALASRLRPCTISGRPCCRVEHPPLKFEMFGALVEESKDVCNGGIYWKVRL